MLKKLRLHNFRTYLNFEVPFSERHLIIGRNNSGKTNLCSALRLLRATATSDLASAVARVPGGIAEIKNWAFSGDTAEILCTCELSFEGQPIEYTYSLKIATEASAGAEEGGYRAARVADERLAVRASGFEDVALLESDGYQAHLLHEPNHLRSSDPRTVDTLAPRDATMLSKLYELDTNKRAVLFRRYLSNWCYFALSPMAMRQGWRDSPADPTSLDASGSNLAYALYHLKNFDEQAYRRIVEYVQAQAEPDLQAINFFTSPDQEPVPMIAHRYRKRASWAGLSDGTIRLLALAFIIETTGVSNGLPSLAIIEEPENGLYPGGLRTFFDRFEAWSPAGQFIFTSHSPYFINFFDGARDSVTLLRRNKETTELVPMRPAEDDPDRELLAEQYSMELLD